MTLNVTCSFFELNSSFIIPIYLENKSQTLGRLSSFYSRRLKLISHLFVKNKIVNRGGGAKFSLNSIITAIN